MDDSGIVALAVETTSGPTPTWIWVLLGLILAGNIFLVIATLWQRWSRSRKSHEELTAEFREKIRCGVPDVRGCVRISPSEFPGVSAEKAVEIAKEEGFLRQTYRDRGEWVFFRQRLTPAGEPDSEQRWPDELSPAPGPEADLKNKRDRLLVGWFMAFLAGGVSAIAHVLNWVNGNLQTFISMGDGLLIAVTHLVTLGVIALGFHWLRKYRFLGKS